MKKSLLSIGLGIVLFVPVVAIAASGDELFRVMFESSDDTNVSVYPEGKMEAFIIEAMKSWNGKGIVLTSEDIRAAVDNPEGGICADDKVDSSGKKIEFIQGTCAEFTEELLSLIRGEKEADLLAKDLVMITNGAELSVSDEPNRPIHMAHNALLLRRVWSGTGAGIIPWDEANDELVKDLERVIGEEVDIETVVYRFRHGYFRDGREADPSRAGIGIPVAEKLRALADVLKISGDQTAVGEFAVPKLGGNIGFWARKDDIGLYWVYPTHFVFSEIRTAGTYPAIVSGGENLAYPYTYKGTNASANTRTPLCSRTTAGKGYACRSLPTKTPNCVSVGGDSEIVLTKCSEGKDTHEVGPDICKDLQNLYLDDGTPLTVDSNFSRLNPALKPADTSHLCTPETATLYQDEIISHACYIGHCLEQSMSGNTLVPNRNTTLVSEATSPYLACVRTDPQLGMYTEVAEDTPYPLPPYLGLELVQSFEQYYCGMNGKTAHPVLGFCRYRDEDQSKNPPKSQVLYTQNIFQQEFLTGENQDNLAETATNIGYRSALLQSLEVNRKVFATLTGLVQQIADLLNELKRAPLTKTACPWTGPFASSSSVSSAP